MVHYSIWKPTLPFWLGQVLCLTVFSLHATCPTNGFLLIQPEHNHHPYHPHGLAVQQPREEEATCLTLQMSSNFYDDDEDDDDDEDNDFPTFMPPLPNSNTDEDDDDDDDEDNDFPTFMPPLPTGLPKGSGGPGLPPGLGGLPGMMSPPDKSVLYSDTELMDLLNLHEGISDTVAQPTAPANTNILLPGEQAGDGPSLHDMVLQALAGDDDDESKSDGDGGEANSDSILLPGEETPAAGGFSLHDMVLQALEKEKQANNKDNSDEKEDTIEKRISNIVAIASDVDGTLLSSDHELNPRTEAAIRKAVEQVQSSDANSLQYFFPATGKSRKGALDSLGTEMRELLYNLPGVFIQGLYVLDQNGNVVFEKRLTASAIQKAEELGKKWGLTLLGYDGDELYSNEDTEFAREIHTKWGEPLPQPISSLANHPNGLHKILLMDRNVDKLANEVRTDLEALAKDNDASVTQAIPTMLELLPAGCSKAMGVEKLCQALGINPGEQLLAIGDAENDVGMLQMAAIGVAVNNACDIAKESADIVMDESNDEGGAGAAMEQYSPLLRDDTQ